MRVIYFCGHRSLFGRQVWSALQASRLKPSVVVLGSNSCWDRFDKRLNRNNRSFRQRLGRRYYRIKNGRWVQREIRGRADHVLRTDDANSRSFLEKLAAYKGDLYFGAAFPQIFGRELLKQPSKAFYNFHPSLLPAFGGAHPHFWAIRTGAERSGISVHQATEKIDRGKIVSQVEFPIAELNYSEFYQEIGRQLPALIGHLEATLLDGAPPVLCNQGVRSSWYNNNQPEDARINWMEFSIEEVRNVIRTGLAWCIYKTRKLRILEGDVFSSDERLSENAPIGRIMRNGAGQVHIRCKDGWLRVGRWRWERLRFKPRLESGEMVY